MSHWTTKQIAILCNFAHLGAEQVRHELAQIGVERSVTAIQVQASRQGISLAHYETCPKCGQRVKTLERTGFCRACEVKARTALIREECARIERRQAKDETAALREYNAAKQRLYRLRKNQNEKK